MAPLRSAAAGEEDGVSLGTFVVSRPRRLSGHSAPNRLEPQTEQKALTRPSSGL
jgi:hypothetical protein